MPVLSSHLTEAFAAVESVDWDRVEDLRPTITVEDHGDAARLYVTLESWSQKAALIQLVQDKMSPALLPMMRDYLSAPRGDDDTLWLSKVVAILHLRGRFDDFGELYAGGPERVDAEARALQRG
jgi:hypothetical protein